MVKKDAQSKMDADLELQNQRCVRRKTKNPQPSPREADKAEFEGRMTDIESRLLCVASRKTQ